MTRWKINDSDVAMLRRMADRERQNTPVVSQRGHVLPRMLGGGKNIYIGVVDPDDIEPGTTGTAQVWDRLVTPPVDTGKTAEVTLDWMHSDLKIEAGKQIAWIDFGGGLNRIFWSECPDPQVNLYQQTAGYPVTITPDVTTRMPLELGATATGDVAFNIVGGNSLEAVADFALSYEMSIACTYVMGQNSEIQTFIDIAVVSGTPTIIKIPLADSFQTSRAGSFQRTFNLPSGRVQFSAGDIIAFDATNLASSSGDLVLDQFILGWVP